jgi:alkylmercury lyase
MSSGEIELRDGHSEPAKSIDTRGLADELAAAMPPLGGREQCIAISLYRLLAEGRPVPTRRVAERAGLRQREVAEVLEEWPGVYLHEGAVVGFWGLALDRMPHRLHVEGRELRAWCAWDTLFLPELIGKPAQVESTCPVTGQTVSLEVIPGAGLRKLSPAGAVLSFRRTEEPFDVVRFCHFVHFFASEEAGADWTATHPDTFLLSIEDGFEIGRLTNRAKFGASLLGVDGV